MLTSGLCTHSPPPNKLRWKEEVRSVATVFMRYSWNLQWLWHTQNVAGVTLVHIQLDKTSHMQANRVSEVENTFLSWGSYKGPGLVPVSLTEEDYKELRISMVSHTICKTEKEGFSCTLRFTL